MRLAANALPQCGLSPANDSSTHAQAMPTEFDWTSSTGDQPGPCSSNDAWGSLGNDWGSPSSTPLPTAASPHSVFDYKDLEQALNSYQQYDRSEQSSRGKQASSAAMPDNANVESCSMDLHGSQLPGFYLNMVPDAAAKQADLSAEDQHIAELLAAYQQAVQEVCPVLTEQVATYGLLQNTAAAEHMWCL